MSRIVAVFVVLCGLSLLCGAAVYKASDFQAESHYEGRSGDITLFPNKMMEDDAQFILLDNMFNYKTEMSGLPESAVGELIAHMMGSASLNSGVSKVGFPKTDLFNRPKANLLFTIAGTGAETSKVNNKLKVINAAAHSHAAITERRCRDAACSLTSMMTSSTPSVHGIIASKWADANGNIVKAFTADNAMSVAANLMDTFLENWNSKSLLVSGSACIVTAAALSAHPSKDTTVQALHYSSERKQFVPLYKRSDDVLAIKKADILNIIQNLAIPGASISVQGDLVQVTFDDSELSAAEFDLSNKADFAFFSEIAFVQNVLEKLQSDAQLSALVADSNPDVFAFGFVGLKAIQTKHGKASKESVAAVTLLDSFINAVAGEMSSIYRGRMITEVVLMGTAHDSPLDNQDARNIAFSRLSSTTTEDRFNALYPEIYMGRASQLEITTACFDLKSQLHNFALDAYCPEKVTRFQNFNRVEASNTTGNNTDGDDPNPKFQILLWSGILIALAIMGAIGVMCCMDVGKDSIIYRTQSHHPHSQ